MSTLFERLSAIDDDLKLSHSKMAAELGIDRSTYYKYKNGTLAIPKSILIILRLKGYNDLWVLSGKGQMKLKDSAQLVEMQKRLKLISKLDSYGVLDSIEKLPETPSSVQKKIIQEFFVFLASKFV
ncbi:helix-turn-helix transcriptional regulator [Leptospira interrogans]|uniref:helix-turn-helix transcriptional regulator n=1 Tax=Leptospira interrogans TaxID=173 RepID=UPI00138FEA57|nr:helix-turn-helix transcriptional regulator [Leptospira interrogans]MCR8648984.1 DNA-binding protein [Leptospira interrogans serovar Bataviae]QOI40812.1 helix-turn-helix transcriptional regulator [Leptospira interrogans serovar Bataviae]QYY62669.1 helix-turn-helix domain-containing protein [Leptospira interrogans serovar Bataviae]